MSCADAIRVISSRATSMYFCEMSIPMNFRSRILHAAPVVPRPQNGSSTTSSLYVRMLIARIGRSRLNGAGFFLLCVSARYGQTPFTASMNSSRVIVETPRELFFHFPLPQSSTHSPGKYIYGLELESHEPQAVYLTRSDCFSFKSTIPFHVKPI